MRKAFLLCFALLILGFASSAVSTPGEFTASSCCRQQCSLNSHCDRICGKGLGSCVQVNSCCRQCICAVA
ncbi:MAG TPA: hypothetical protein VF756_25470 [Thermoanaerobaculia bacterium]